MSTEVLTVGRRGSTVGMVGCGRIGSKRADALARQDVLLACCDLNVAAAEELAGRHGCKACAHWEQVEAACSIAAHAGMRPSATSAIAG